jgi:polyisoprenoid-binding protein YceI
MRAIVTAIVVLAVAFGLFWALKPQAPSDVQTAKVGPAASTTPVAKPTPAPTPSGNLSLTSFTFTGYGPGKSHDGTFADSSVSNVSFGTDGTPTSGRFTIKTASVKTDSEKLDGHLCAEDFFNCAANPEIVFDLTSIKPVAQTNSATPTVGATLYDVSGTLTFNKVTQPISFQATGRTTNPKTFSADFKFDTTFFNFKYVGIDKEVRIQFAGEVR